MDSSPHSRASRRSLLLFGGGFIVLAIVVASMFSVYRSGQRTLNDARQVIGVEAFWNWSQGSAVLALHSYALSGYEEDLSAYEEALALPRAMRPAIETSSQDPEAAEELRAASAPLISADAVDFWIDWMDRYGQRSETPRVAEARVQKDSLLQMIEAEAEGLERTVAEEGPGSPGVQQIARRIRDVNDQIAAINEPLFFELIQQEAAAKGSMERSMRTAAFSLLLGGGLLVGLLMARARRAEDSVVENEARFRQMATSIQEVFWLAEADTRRFLYVSPAYASVWGRPVEELYANSNAWLEGVHPEDRERLRQSWESGQDLPFEQEYRVITPSGNVRHVRNRTFPVRSEGGKVVRLTGVATDVTRRKALEEEILQSQRLRSIGRLAGGVAHEFNNLLTVIQGHLLLLLSDRSEDDDLVREVNHALHAAQKAGEVTRNLLSFAGSQILLPRPLDLAGFVRESEKMLSRMLPDGVVVETSLEDEVRVEVDPSFLSEILLTLTTRALKAMPDGGLLRLQVEALQTWREIPVEGRTLPAGPWATLVVEDTGTPIPEEMRDRFFEPFGPVDDGGEHFRLELASVFGIVEQSGGGIRVDFLQDGPGTRFTVHLPRIDAGHELDAGDETVEKLETARPGSRSGDS